MTTKQHFTRRAFLKGMAMTGAGAALAACAAPAAPAATDSGEEMPAAEAAMLRVQAPAGNGALMPREFATRFMDETGVQVEVEDTIYGEIETKTQTGFISGTLQDLVYGHHRWIFINFLKGIYLEIDDLLDGVGSRRSRPRSRCLRHRLRQHDCHALLQQRIPLLRRARFHRFLDHGYRGPHDVLQQ
ncbi:MAG: extracellular solute-binding protein [Holophagales bacterium]|nr:extracellular solute-binding protein [Holophagales bacterium]